MQSKNITQSLNSTHNIFSLFETLKLLSECYYNSSLTLLMNNQNHLENRFLVVLKEVNHSYHLSIVVLLTFFFIYPNIIFPFHSCKRHFLQIMSHNGIIR